MSPAATATLSQLDASRPGRFQRLEHDSADGARIRIVDEIHGMFEISEPVLLRLLETPALLRLREVHQHGVTGLLGFTAPVTRYEHSVGAMLLVRKAGGGLAEQVFGLLHDVSHTALSHVVDWALSAPGASFHEEQMQAYVAATELPPLLAAHGFRLPACMDEAAFPLVEQPSPHLCADRLDYALRDAVGHGHLALEEARAVSDQVVATPDPAASASARSILALRDPATALRLARAYLATDRDAWSNPAHVDLYRRTGIIIREAIESKKLTAASLWSLSDVRFWDALRDAATADQRDDMAAMARTAIENHTVDTLPPATKVRTLDPDIVSPEGTLAPLSAVCPEYQLERQQYIAARQAMMPPST